MKELNNNFLCAKLASSKVFSMFINKNSLSDMCCTNENNLGMISDKYFNNMQEARRLCETLSYSQDAYVGFKNGVKYLSYDSKFVPVVQPHVTKQDIDNFCIYRYIVTNEDGSIDKAIILKKTENGLLQRNSKNH
jgi:hypothetical protein